MKITPLKSNVMAFRGQVSTRNKTVINVMWVHIIMAWNVLGLRIEEASICEG
jgi:hypothetical protein